MYIDRNGDVVWKARKESAIWLNRHIGYLFGSRRREWTESISQEGIPILRKHGRIPYEVHELKPLSAFFSQVKEQK